MGEKRLKTVAEHERDATAKRFAQTPGYPSGVACPRCGAELIKFIGGVKMLEHYGGRKPVFCRKCNYEGTIA